MSIYIKGLDIPQDGIVRVIMIESDGSVRFYGGSSVIAKAIEVPPHGRCIDADKLDTRDRGNNSQRIMWSNIRQIIADADTIIPADKEEEEPRDEQEPRFQ